MRKFAMRIGGREKAYRKPVHRINPETKRTYCQIENAALQAAFVTYRGSGLRKFDVPPEGNPMCKNCETLYARAADQPDAAPEETK